MSKLHQVGDKNVLFDYELNFANLPKHDSAPNTYSHVQFN